MATFLGIDFGTGGCKVTAVSAAGAILGEAGVEYGTMHPFPGWAEQNPEAWYPAMCAALKLLRERGVDFSQIAGIAFDGSTHNAVLLDSAMKPVRHTIMWTDQRSVVECDFLKRQYGDLIYQTAYQQPTPTWTLPQLLWLRNHEPEVLAKTRHILFVKDFVRYLVTGEAVTDYIEAEGTLFYDMRRQCWSEELAALAGVSPEMLPKLVKPTDVVGRVTPAAARDTGIPAGTLVVCGASDSAVEDYGAGAVEPGDMIIKLATAGNVNVMTAQPCPSPGTLTYSHVIDSMWYTVAATNAAALCQRWFRDTFCEFEKMEAARLDLKAFQLMDDAAVKSPPGANGVMFHPYLQGERSPYWDARLRASFIGMSIASTKGDFIRALFEGVAFSLYDCYCSLAPLNLPVKRIFLIGGGARGKLWSEIVCNVFQLPVQIPSPGDASFGAALLAGTGTGYFKSSREAVAQCLKIDREIAPDPAISDFYRAQYPVYRQIHDALAPIYAQR